MSVWSVRRIAIAYKTYRSGQSIPMVQMMLVRLNSRAGLYSVLRLLSHSALVLPNSWCANEEAMAAYVSA